MKKAAVHRFADIVRVRMPLDEWKSDTPEWKIAALMQTIHQLESRSTSGLILTADELSVADEMPTARKSIFQGQRVSDDQRLKAMAQVEVATAALASGIQSPQHIRALPGSHYSRVSHFVPKSVSMNNPSARNMR